MEPKYRFFTVKKKGRLVKPLPTNIGTHLGMAALSADSIPNALCRVNYAEGNYHGVFKIVQYVDSAQYDRLRTNCPDWLNLNQVTTLQNTLQRKANIFRQYLQQFDRDDHDASELSRFWGSMPYTHVSSANVKNTIRVGITSVLSVCGDVGRFLNNRRIIMAPSRVLKELQRDAAFRLGYIPLHSAAYGFVRGRNAYGCAKAHLDYHSTIPQLVINMDVQSFFQSFSEDQVRTGLIKNGVPEGRTQEIIDICMVRADMKLFMHALVDIISTQRLTTRMSPNIRRDLERLERFMYHFERSNDPMIQQVANMKQAMLGHLGCGPNIKMGDLFLPQGSPASPVLSNLAFKIADYRINALARTNGAYYTRYADDLSFSWKERLTTRKINIFMWNVKNILEDYGLIAHPNKSKVMGPGIRQEIVGYAINSGTPTIPKRYREDALVQSFQLESAQENGKIREVDVIRGISTMKGKAAYIKTCHPRDAKAVQDVIERVERNIDALPTRSITSINSGEIETVIQPSMRKIQL